MKTCCVEDQLRAALDQASFVLVGAGAGLSASAGYCYDGERFKAHFGDFIDRYGFSDMYSGGFYPFDSLEEHWGYWSRYIKINRYEAPPKRVYEDLLSLLEGRDYFVLTTNVDHCFQRAGVDRERLFYTQGDFGLWQCSVPCHDATYDNEEQVLAMVSRQKDRRVPPELVPFCSRCGAPMTMNLRSDDRFVEDQGWHRAASRYRRFLDRCRGGRVLFLELGVGGNTPGIIKFPFWRMTAQNPLARYVCLNLEEPCCPPAIESQSLRIRADIGAVLRKTLENR